MVIFLPIFRVFVGATSLGFPFDFDPASLFEGEEERVVLGCLAGGIGFTCSTTNTSWNIRHCCFTHCRFNEKTKGTDLEDWYTCFVGIRSSSLMGLGTGFLDRFKFLGFCFSALGSNGGGCFGNGGASARIIRSCIVFVCKACLNTSCALKDKCKEDCTNKVKKRKGCNVRRVSLPNFPLFHTRVMRSFTATYLLNWTSTRLVPFISTILSCTFSLPSL